MHCMHTLMSLLCLRCWVWREVQVLWSYASWLALKWYSSTPDVFDWYHCRSLSLFGNSATVWKVTACIGRRKIMKINKTQSTLTKADIHWSLYFLFNHLCIICFFVFRNSFQLYDKGESVCLWLKCLITQSRCFRMFFFYYCITVLKVLSLKICCEI